MDKFRDILTSKLVGEHFKDKKLTVTRAMSDYLVGELSSSIVFGKKIEIITYSIDPAWISFGKCFMSKSMQLWCDQSEIAWKWTVEYSTDQKRLPNWSYKFIFNDPSDVSAFLLKFG